MVADPFADFALGTSALIKWNDNQSTVFQPKLFYVYIQGVPGGMDKTSGECSLC